MTILLRPKARETISEGALGGQGKSPTFRVLARDF
jgi:hypothetical protein